MAVLYDELINHMYFFQALGREGFRERIRSCCFAAHNLWYRISKLPNVRVLSRAPMCPNEVLPLNEVTSNPATSPVSIPFLMQNLTPLITHTSGEVHLS